MTGQPPSGPEAPHYRGFTITLRSTPLESDQPFADIYPTTHTIYKRQTSMAPAGFEPAIPASDQPQNHTLEGVASGMDTVTYYSSNLNQILRKIPKSSPMTRFKLCGIRNGHIKNKYQKRFIRINVFDDFYANT